eukprot:12100779-Alexandrium_andersonii.AAC.1
MLYGARRTSRRWDVFRRPPLPKLLAALRDNLAEGLERIPTERTLTGDADRPRLDRRYWEACDMEARSAFRH